MKRINARNQEVSSVAATRQLASNCHYQQSKETFRIPAMSGTSFGPLSPLLDLHSQLAAPVAAFNEPEVPKGELQGSKPKSQVA
ncbi:hypothetical protein [Bradyrhizobium sp. SRS-191]|uniref:hypothetical protein n=1 Tax=Bradyrhizobium sp. SRS-191 TaxID=2962606 RepID=UPI00211DEF38|nr:hypothetical protein [Bradyrhizobium sp. SRS-191]